MSRKLIWVILGLLIIITMILSVLPPPGTG